MRSDDRVNKLEAYLAAQRKLFRRCEEAVRWNGFAEQTGGGVVTRRSGDSRSGQDMGAIKSTAMAIEAEARSLEEEVKRLRRQLLDAIGKMPTPRYRDVLDAIYILGKSRADFASAYGIAGKTVGNWLADAIAELEQYSDFFK